MPRHKPSQSLSTYLPLLQYDASELASLHDHRHLLLDDVHLFCGIAAWEEQLFNLCQLCLAQQGSLWFSADAAPAQLPWALRDLQSRMQLALVYEVHELSDAGKLQALARQAAQRGIELKEDCAQYLLARHPRQMHELMAVLAKLDTQALAEQRKLTIPFIKAVMQW
jgi:DnaA-homolog protein